MLRCYQQTVNTISHPPLRQFYTPHNTPLQALHQLPAKEYIENNHVLLLVWHWACGKTIGHQTRLLRRTVYLTDLAVAHKNACQHQLETIVSHI